MSDIEEAEVKPEEAKFICNECDKLFIKPYDIRQHYKIYHEEVKPLPRFFLLRYPRKVLNETAYKCEYCETEFSTNELLDQHLIKCVSKLIKENSELKKQIKQYNNCKCKEEIKELKEVVKVLKDLVIDVLKIKYSKDKYKKKVLKYDSDESIVYDEVYKLNKNRVIESVYIC